MTLKSWDPQGSCGFDSRPRHQSFQQLTATKSGPGSWAIGPFCLFLLYFPQSTPVVLHQSRLRHGTLKLPQSDMRVYPTIDLRRRKAGSRVDDAIHDTCVHSYLSATVGSTLVARRAGM